MVCLEFPPVNTTGNYRSAGFARVFKKAGHAVEVITSTIDSGVNTFNKSVDEQLLEGLETIKIHRFPIRPLSKIYSKGLGNALRIWWKTTDNIVKRWYTGEAISSIDKIIKTFNPDHLYVSLPPFSVANVAIKLKRRHNLSLITDMRDAWSLWATSPYPTRFHYKKVKRLEHTLFEESSIILGVTKELVSDFEQQHPYISKKKFNVIFNGYDKPNDPSKQSINQPDTSDIYKIGYVGSFYYEPSSEALMSLKWYKRPGLKKLWYSPRKEHWSYRSPLFFIKTIAKYNATNPKRKIQFEFVGKEPNWLIDMINSHQLSESYVAHGFKSKSDVLAIQQSWNGILATSEKIIGSPHFCLPSKSFDYINALKPIFAFITEGAQQSFFKNYPQVFHFNPDDIEQNVKKIEEVTLKKNVTYKAIDPSFFRESLCQNLLEIIDNVNY